VTDEEFIRLCWSRIRARKFTREEWYAWRRYHRLRLHNTGYGFSHRVREERIALAALKIFVAMGLARSGVASIAEAWNAAVKKWTASMAEANQTLRVALARFRTPTVARDGRNVTIGG
jgi:hypothetical protein